jgi:2-oxoglutarate dehydrogenase E2 component (dihydrolipoamide succinyltransferase)
MAVIEIRVPSIAESVTEVTLSQWLKADGEMIKLDEPICEFESDKATLELPAEAAGKIKHAVTEGSDLKIGDLIATIDTDAAGASAAPVAAPKAEAKAAEPAPVASANYATGTPSPTAGKVLAEANIAAADVKGTGRDGRITQADAQQAAAAKTSQPVVNQPVAAPKAEAKPAAATPTVAAPSVAFARTERRVKMSRMRQTIAKRLVSAKNTTAMLTTFNEVDMSAVMAFREKYQDRFVKKYGIKLGFMSLFAKACAKVLLEMPDVNAFIDSTTNEIIYHDYADISLAISTPTGLVVPPIRNVESLNFAQFESQLKALAVKARDGKLTLEEMSGGTFTITNGGVFGSLMSTPIINEPQSAILGMHAIKDRAVVVDGQIVIRPMMYLALSYDHRVIDGSTSVTFLVKVKELIEDPTTLLLDI